jgi:ADP-ribose pyrophosphatase YjhB (NUDIX family)
MSNEKALSQYDIKKYRTPDGYTSDIAVFTISSERKQTHQPPVMTLKIMLIQRSMTNGEGDHNIEAGKWALPGGFVDPNETAYQAAKRELEEETSVKNIHLKHYGTYDTPGRDPRGWIITNAHYAIVPENYLLERKANDDATDVKLFSLEELKKTALAFDHEQIINDAIVQIEKDLLQTTVAEEFLPSEFTYSELQALLLTVTKDPAISSEQSFSRKIKTLPFIEEVQNKTTNRNSKKPAKLFRFIKADVVTPIYTAKY